MESICGSPYWNYKLTWQGESPDFTQCFQETALIWLPCSFIWLFSASEYSKIRRLHANAPKDAHGNRYKVPWTLISFLKIFLAALLLALSLCQLTSVLIRLIMRSEQIDKMYPVQWLTPSIQVATFTLVIILLLSHRSYAVQSSGVLFIFWLLYSITSSFTYYSLWKHLNNSSSSVWQLSRVDYITRMIMIPVIMMQLLLSCFNDSLPYDYVAPGHHFSAPTPELTASFPSILTFYWVNPLIYLGYTRPLKIDDLYDLRNSDRTDTVYRKFMGHFDRSKATSVTFPLFLTFASEFSGTLFLKLISNILVFVNPVLLDYLLEWMVTRKPYWQGFVYAGAMFATSVLESAVNNQSEYRLSLVSNRMRSALTDAIYRKTLVLSPDARSKYSTGQLVNLMAVDATRVTQFMWQVHTVWSAPLLISLSIYLLWQQLGLAAIAGVVVIIALIPINGWITMLWRKSQQALMKDKDKRSKLLNEVLSGIRVLKLYGWEPSFKKKIAEARAGECKRLKTQSVYMAGVTFTISSASVFIAIASFITYSLIDSANVLSPSKAFVSLTLFNILRQPMMMLPFFLTFYTTFTVAMKRIGLFLSAEEADHRAICYVKEENDATDPSESPVAGTSSSETEPPVSTCYASQDNLPVQFKQNVIYIESGNFSWSSDFLNLTAHLQDINLSIAKGSLVAIVGSVGSGKSNLLSAILNEMIKITGSGQVKGTIAYVPQQAWIQNATVKSNILFMSKYSQSRYKKIIESTALDADIKVLAAGDETEIGEKGINLSGGQKQRVSLARAIYSDADIYLMDDPLSAVDSHVGKHIFEKALGPTGLLKKKTRLLVTHKVTLLPQVDFIVVMKDGKISESGSYHQLLEKKGAFSEFLVEYLAESADVVEDDPAQIAEMRDQVKPELERHMSRISATASSKGSDSDLRSRKVSISTNSSAKPSRRNTNFSDDTATSSKAREGASKDAMKRTGHLIEIESEAVGSVPFSLYRDYFRAMGFTSVFSVVFSLMISNGLTIASSIWLSQWADDALYPDRIGDTSLLAQRIGVYGALGILECAFQFTGNFVTFLATLRASALLHDLMLDRVMQSPMSFFDTTPQGRILNRFTKDVDSLDISIRMSIRQFLSAIFRSIVTLIIISFESPFFLILAVPLIFIYYFIQKYYIATSRQLKRIEATTRSPIYSQFSETVAGASSIRAYGVTGLFIKQCEEKNDINSRSSILANAASRWLAVRLEVIGSLILLVTILLAVTAIGTSNPALAGLAISYALTTTQMLNMVIRASVELENNLVSAERIIEYTKIENEADWYIDSTRPRSEWPDQGLVTFDNYSTRYREGLDLVLRRISFESKAAEKIGLVGRTGAGKSSITLAMFRLIEPVNGSITVDGLDISRLGLMELRSRITIIPQEPILFTGSLRMNLDPFDKHTDNELWHALDLAHLRSFVSSLEGGLNFQVAEGAENMSVGQRQLVCLARALLRKSKILVLDEATAAVDLETDDLIQKTIRKEFANCTILTIAHRLNTIIDYDRILVLEDGEVAEFDTPQALLANPNSKFHSMAQASGLL